jgi:hypothetical protein
VTEIFFFKLFLGGGFWNRIVYSSINEKIENVVKHFKFIKSNLA